MGLKDSILYFYNKKEAVEQVFVCFIVKFFKKLGRDFYE